MGFVHAHDTQDSGGLKRDRGLRGRRSGPAGRAGKDHLIYTGSNRRSVLTSLKRGTRAYFIDQNANRVERVSVEAGTPETVNGTPVPNAFVTGTRLSYPDLAPDNRSVALLIELGDKGLGQMIAVVPLDAGSQPHVRLLDPNPAISSSPRFSPDGKALVYVITQNGVDNLWFQPLDGSARDQLTNFKLDRIRSFRWSPDGKSLGVLCERVEGDVVLLRESSTTK